MSPYGFITKSVFHEGENDPIKHLFSTELGKKLTDHKKAQTLNEKAFAFESSLLSQF